MSTNAGQLANHIRRTVSGPMWHGAALAELLTDVSVDDARMRPIAGAHTIWELVLHATAWADIARARLRGERTGDPTTEEDWPPPGRDASEWRAAVSQLEASYKALANATRALDDEALNAKVRGLDYTVSTLLHGVVEHGTYHGGQIALLKRAMAAVAHS
jgi:uncharacterized damage-inducible protein DinB